jgi:eukaryotic-like serine/threonine-protein kinase
MVRPMLRPGDSFERYKVDAVIGQGGMGTVYRAHDARLERHVALKVIADGAASPEAKARLQREARAAAAFDHPNAVSIFDVGEIDGAPYIVMELVAGRTLREAVGAGSVPTSTRVTWLKDVARALGAAHKRGLVHRDVKPENVMVRDDGVVKVLDFGIARRSHADVDPSGPTATAAPALPTLTRDGVNLGTPLYMAPEQIKGDPLDGRADQFAWGVLGYELLTGRVPWRGADALGVVASILTDEPAEALLDSAGASPEVKAAILRALSKRPSERFASMDELLRALDADAPSVPPPSPAATRAAERPAPPTEPADRAAPPLPDGLSTTDKRRYSTQEVRDILARAVERQEQEPDTRLRFDDLLAAAREVGVEDDVLREASREIRQRAEPQGSRLAPAAGAAAAPSAKVPAVALDAAGMPASEAADDEAAFQAWRRRKRRGFLRHLGVYIFVNGALLLMGLLTGHPQMAVGGIFWAIGLGIHGMNALFASRDDWEDRRQHLSRRERREQERLARHRERRQRRQEAVDRAIEEGASLLLAAGTKIRERIEGAASKATSAAKTATAKADAAAKNATAKVEAAATARAAGPPPDKSRARIADAPVRTRVLVDSDEIPEPAHAESDAAGASGADATAKR